MKLVLAYISQIRWPSEIPAGPFNASFMQAAARAGVDVHMIVRSSHHPRAAHDSDPYDVLEHEYGLQRHDNLHIHVIPTPAWKPMSDRVVFFERAGWLLRRLVKQYGVNTVMSRDTRAIPYLARWRRRGLVAVHDTHNFYMDLDARDEPSARRKRSYQYYERRFLPKLDGLLPLLEIQAEQYRKHLAIPVRAAHPGLHHANPPVPDRFDRHTVAYVGSFSSIKGAGDLVAMLKRLDNETRLLLIGGRGSVETEAMRQRIRQQALQDRAEVTGWLPVPALLERLREASVAVLSLRDTFYNRYLTAPSKLFNYLEQALPLVASDLPAIRELAGDAALYVPPEDNGALEHALRTLLTDRSRHEALADTAHQRARSLLWIERGHRLREFLEELHGNR
ncbi:glycosyltransferase [bacterium]|nr:glycosyltransferase [bacterium]